MAPITAALLLDRLDAIAASLRARAGTLALIGLGSVGLETDRLDAFSDLDFFVVVERGCKARFIDGLDWLAQAHPLAWHFRNTVDGHKALMADGVFCEFAVFEPDELAAIPFAPGRVVWRRDEVDASIAAPRRPLPAPARPDEDWIVGEALSNLLVGLARWQRGERLAALRMIQGHALDRLIELASLREPPAPAATGRADPFNAERRVEQRLPVLAHALPRLVPGYDGTPRAALAVLEGLEALSARVPRVVAQRVRALADAALQAAPAPTPPAAGRAWPRARKPQK